MGTAPFYPSPLKRGVSCHAHQYATVYGVPKATFTTVKFPSSKQMHEWIRAVITNRAVQSGVKILHATPA